MLFGEVIKMGVNILPLDLLLVEKIGGNYSLYREWLYEEMKVAANVSDLETVKQKTAAIEEVQNSLLNLNETIAKFNNDIENINIRILKSKEVKV